MAPSLAVLGPGGVGGFVAGALEHAGTPVLVVARETTAAALAADGLEIRSRALRADFTVRPPTAPALEQPVDVLLVATKATALEAALERVDAQPGLVVPLLNGLAHREPLARRFGTRAVAGTIRVESDRPRTGLVVQTSPSVRVEVASDDPDRRPALDELVALLEAAGVAASIGASEAQVTWSKLCRLCALALATTAFDLPLGPIRTTPELRDDLRACVAEACAVAATEGAAIDPAATVRELDEAHAELGSSMQRDVRAGREPELDAIAWSVVRAGGAHGVGTPTIERLAGLIAARIARS